MRDLVAGRTQFLGRGGDAGGIGARLIRRRGDDGCALPDDRERVEQLGDAAGDAVVAFLDLDPGHVQVALDRLAGLEQGHARVRLLARLDLLPLLGAVGQFHLKRPQLGGQTAELRHGGDFDHMGSILTGDGVEVLLETAERRPHGAQQQPARRYRRDDGQDQRDGRLTEAAAQFLAGAGVFLAGDTDLKIRQFPVGADHVLEQRQQLPVVVFLQAGAVSLRGDGQRRFQAVAQEHGAAVLEAGGQDLFLFREVGRHVLRPRAR